MKFGGFQKTSLIDFPSKICSVLFVKGCNLRCPFCYNWRLIFDSDIPCFSEKEAYKILDSRKKYVEAVVITGGEPTLYKKLPTFIKRLKEKSYYVKLDTNGFFPEVLKKCLPFLDYIAMDVKTSLQKYRLLGASETDSLMRSIKILKEKTVDYEFRNTVVPGFVNKKIIQKIGILVRGAEKFVFQQFQPWDTLDKNLLNTKPFPPEKLNSFVNIIEKYVQKVEMRI
jgi:pyruvate formate lyase activating enzyme